MVLAAGTLLGPYEILAPLGAGGMGEVFRARDTRLGRDVAVKVLPDHLSDDPSALARFGREARAVAALSHPNILFLLDVGETNGIHYAVTELLEGETLRALVARGQVPVKRALEIAHEMAEGLAAAHEKGIVHRDVKPENAFLTRDGHVKVLDFGLARHETAFRDPGDTHSPTVSARTEAGAVMGTVAYMSPEQARGNPVDHRTDQFSLGVTLYEMLAGKRPFRGETAAETMTAILREEPEPLSALAPSVPAPVRWLVERCLSKDPAQRYDSTRDLARDLSTLGLHLSDARLSTASAATPREGGRYGRLRPGSVAAVVALAVLATAAVTTVLVRGLGRTALPVTRFEIRLPDGHYLSQYRQPFAFSPDGRLLVYSAFTWKTPFLEQNPPQLFLRPLDSFEARPIPGTEGGFQPVFSPDGRHVAFAARAEKGFALRRVPVAGGPVSTVCESEIPFGLAWSADGYLFFAEELGPLLRVPATGGTPDAITKLDVAGSEVSHRLPHLLPDGRTLLYTSLRWSAMGMSWKKARVFAERVGETGRSRSLVADWASDARWAPPGHVLFAREGRLYAAPFDEKRLGLGGAASPILESVRHSIWTVGSPSETGAAMVDVAGGGLVSWVNGSVTPPGDRSLVWVDASGKETPVDVPRGPFVGGRLSPDGGTLLVQYAYPGRQLEVLDLARGARRNVTFGMNPRWAVWGPGPGRITFQSDHEGPWRIYSRRVDAGSEEVETLRQDEASLYSSPGAWSRDGRVLAFRVFDRKTKHDIWLLERGKGARPLVASQFSEMHPDISPDGRWLVYTSNEPGRFEVFVRPLEGGGASEQVSAGGGAAPIWSGDGSVILYWSLAPGGGRSGLFRVRFGSSAKGLSLGRPEKLLEAPYFHLWPGRPWDLAPDGRVLIVKDADPAVQRTWFEKALGDRIRVDLGGLPALLEETGKGP